MHVINICLIMYMYILFSCVYCFMCAFFPILKHTFFSHFEWRIEYMYIYKCLFFGPCVDSFVLSFCLCFEIMSENKCIYIWLSAENALSCVQFSLFAMCIHMAASIFKIRHVQAIMRVTWCTKHTYNFMVFSWCSASASLKHHFAQAQISIYINRQQQ